MKRLKLTALWVCLILLAAALPGGRAEQAGKTVRVGWYESTFNRMDASGRRSGYAYDYQQKIAAYSGWRYEYVTGSWPDLMEMLEAGEIDLMSDVSRVAGREERMLFSDLPMGTEEYYIYIAADNREIQPGDAATLNGKTVGVNRGSIQKALFEKWAEENGVTADLVEVSGSEKESLAMLESGKLDAYVELDAFSRPKRTRPVCKIGSSDFYFAVSLARPDLLKELNDAMSRIQDENRFYNQQLNARYVSAEGTYGYLSREEREWLAAHGAIRVGYQDHYMAFCARDEETGELTGALRDYLEAAESCLTNASLSFEPAAYQTAADALEALRRGETDVVFPANLSSYEGEREGVLLTAPVTRTDIYAVVRETDLDLLSREGRIIAAVNEGNPNYEAFLKDHFPAWQMLWYRDTDACLKAVASGMADCVLISYNRYSNIARRCGSLKLTAVPAGVGLDYSFAVREGNRELYSILSRAIGMIPVSTLNAAISNYTAADSQLTFAEYLSEHLTAVIAGVGVLLGAVLALLLITMRAERRSRRLIVHTEKDELTGLYNRGFFLQYAERMYRAHPETPMDAVVLDIDQFHSLNAMQGRELGDRVLSALGRGTCQAAAEREGIAGRFEADRFGIYCRGGGDYQELRDLLQNRVNEAVPGAGIRLRMGVMPWEAGMDPEQLFDRARTACNMARGSFRKHLVYYDGEVSRREQLEQRLQSDLTRALEEYELEVYYQPVFDIRCDPPRLVSAEALARWNHPELGMISPGTFVPLFERNGRISEIDRYVWNHAARKVMAWREESGITLPVSVNLSRVDVSDPGLEETLDQLLDACGLTPADLRLEITETVYTENAEQLIRVVAELRKKGFLVEMDDFGSGYSSLNMLSRMPVDILKMDQAFIRNMGRDSRDEGMVEMILGIGRTMNIPVIAEGVETEAQLKRLRELGCAMVQGFYFSGPLHSLDFEDEFGPEPETRE